MIAYVVRGSLMPACAYAATTRPEQSKHAGPEPPQQYLFPACRSAHCSAVSRSDVVDAEAGAGAPGTRTSTRAAAASAAAAALRRATPRPATLEGLSPSAAWAAATASAGPGIVTVKRDGLRRVLKEDKANLRLGARRALGFRPQTTAGRQYWEPGQWRTRGCGTRHRATRGRRSRTQGASVQHCTTRRAFVRQTGHKVTKALLMRLGPAWIRPGPVPPGVLVPGWARGHRLVVVG